MSTFVCRQVLGQKKKKVQGGLREFLRFRNNGYRLSVWGKASLKLNLNVTTKTWKE